MKKVTLVLVLLFALLFPTAVYAQDDDGAEVVILEEGEAPPVDDLPDMSLLKEGLIILLGLAIVVSQVVQVLKERRLIKNSRAAENWSKWSAFALPIIGGLLTNFAAPEVVEAVYDNALLVADVAIKGYLLASGSKLVYVIGKKAGVARSGY
jgi:hypothetical protein